MDNTWLFTLASRPLTGGHSSALSQLAQLSERMWLAGQAVHLEVCSDQRPTAARESMCGAGVRERERRTVCAALVQRLCPVHACAQLVLDTPNLTIPFRQPMWGGRYMCGFLSRAIYPLCTSSPRIRPALGSTKSTHGQLRQAHCVLRFGPYSSERGEATCDSRARCSTEAVSFKETNAPSVCGPFPLVFPHRFLNVPLSRPATFPFPSWPRSAIYWSGLFNDSRLHMSSSPDNNSVILVFLFPVTA
jgi:hypothetical protein